MGNRLIAFVFVFDKLPSEAGVCFMYALPKDFKELMN